MRYYTWPHMYTHTYIIICISYLLSICDMPIFTISGFLFNNSLNATNLAPRSSSCWLKETKFSNDSSPLGVCSLNKKVDPHCPNPLPNQIGPFVGL